MKKYFKLIILACSLVLSLVSCEEYLDTSSPSAFTEETSFVNIDFASKAVNGVYNNLSITYFWDYYYVNYKYDNDIEVTFANDNGNTYSITHYTATGGTPTMDLTWNAIYSAIERANICIDNLPKSPIWEGKYANDAKRLYGEAVTLRAYFYYELICSWGDVPFKTKSTQAGDNFFLPKTDRDSIYEYLIEDLKNVEEFVPWMTETHSTERVNKAFVKGLRARMALSYAGYSLRNKTLETRRGRYWEDYYKIARDECKEIMESGKHRLNPNFENIFKSLHKYLQDLTYREDIFEVAYGRLYSGRLGGRMIGMPTVLTDPVYGGSYTNYRMAPNYYYSFDRKDQRRDVTCPLYDYATSSRISMQSVISYNGTSFSPAKWRRVWIDPPMGGTLTNAGFTGVNFPLMRYSDVILMFAEAENELNGPTQAAKDALAQVRQRAFPEAAWSEKVTDYINSVSASKEAFFNAVVDERGWEFGGELLRKQDLVRWNLLGTKLAKMKEDCLKIANDDPTYSEHDKVQTYIFWKDKGDGTIEILNPDYRLPSNAIAGYTRANAIGILPLVASTQTAFKNNLNNVAKGYNASKNNHLYPISDVIITSGNGVLSNDQIP